MSRLFRTLHAQLLPIVTAIVLAGCPGNPDDVALVGSKSTNADTATNSETASNQPSMSESQRKRLSQCEDRLSAIIAGLAFDRLGIDTDANTQLADLNNWFTTCGPGDDAKSLANDGELRAAFLPPGMNEVVSQKSYQIPDLAHIRDSMLAKRIGEIAATDPANDLKVMVDLFDHVVRNITFVHGSYGELPLNPTSIWQVGIGSGRDRAWLFALLLRQFRIDSVVLEFPSGFNAEPYVLVAAITRGDNSKAYLFDPILGLPVPALDDDGPIPTKPVTWDIALKNDAVFRALDLPNQAYPIRADRFQSAIISIVGNVSSFAPRIANLQDALPPDSAVQLYDGLGENSLAGTPLLARLAEALAIEEARLQLWPHATFARLASTKLTERTKQLVQTRQDVLGAPYHPVPIIDENGQPVLDDAGKPRIGFQRAENQNGSNVLSGRIAQLTGDERSAHRAYLAVRVTDIPFRLNQVAAIDAAYWTALTQYESGDMRLAKRSLEKFIEREAMSAWEASARRLLATIHAKEENYEAALAATNGKNVDPGTLTLVARWQNLGLLKPAPAEPKKDSEAVDEASDEEPAKAPMKSPGKSSEEKPESDPSEETVKDPKPEQKPAKPDGKPSTTEETPETPNDSKQKPKSSPDKADKPKTESPSEAVKPASQSGDQKAANKTPPTSNSEKPQAEPAVGTSE